MYIVSGVRVDKTGRINISKLFNKIPKKVAVAWNLKTKKLFFIENPKSLEKINTRDIRRVDSKGRVYLPKWVTEELGDYFIVTDQSLQEHSLFPKKFLPSNL